jgi:hypothetical protein
MTNTYWEGLHSPSGRRTNISFVGAGHKSHYFKNSAFVIATTNASQGTIGGAGGAATFDNTTVQFSSATNQSVGTSSTIALELTWINTPNAIQGATIPNTMFASPISNANFQIACRGVDLSAVTGTLMGATNLNSKVLLDSCKIAAGVLRMTVGAAAGDSTALLELVNCWDGINVINERNTQGGNVAQDRGAYLSSGAADDIGSYSLRASTSSRADFAVLPIDFFAFDVENTITGVSKTATVEIVSSAPLNNNDIRLLLEYMGTAGNPMASFSDSFPGVLAAAAALTSSSNTWAGSGFTTLNPQDTSANIPTFSNGNLTATSGVGLCGVRGLTGQSAGKFYWEVTWNQAGAFSEIGVAAAIANIGTTASTNSAYVRGQGPILVNNGTPTGSPTLGSRSNGDIIGMAIDLTAQLMWFRVCPSGNWNGSGTANPATGVGGVSISSIAGTLFPAFWANNVGDAGTHNFGASSFSGAVPSGFNSGWPMLPTGSKQLLQVTFTPQRAGRVRGLVRLGKPLTTVWADPRVIIT